MADGVTIERQPRALAERLRGEAAYLAPSAFAGMYEALDPLITSNDRSVAIVPVRGPLMHHIEWWYDSYDAIVSRVAAALESRPDAVVLSIDSPGGLVAGCFEGAQSIRALCDAAGVPLYAYIDGQATSAAYAIACVCDRIFAPETAIVGSVGVVAGYVDYTRMNANDGIRVEMVASGKRKLDGNPNVEITDAALNALRGRIDSLAEVFFAHVAKYRGLDRDDVAAMEAGLFHGAEAIKRGLVDEAARIDDVITQIDEGAVAARVSGAALASTESNDMKDEQRKALCAMLGLAADASFDVIAASVITMKTDAVPKSDFARVEGERDAARTALATEKARREKAEANVAETSAKAHVAEVEHVLDAACAAGKLKPALRAKFAAMAGTADGLTVVKGLLEDMEPAPLSARQGRDGAPAPRAATGSADALTAEEIEIASAMGIEPDKALANKRAALAITGGAA